MIIDPFSFGLAMPLDLVSGAGAAYSVRKLRTAYSGSALRVRRSSDNTELDIGFSGTGLDTAALLAHCGAGSGFVVTWYDQSGNSRNITQSTTANQPRIVNSGVLDTKNSLPTLVFDGSNDWLANSSPFLYVAGAASGMGVAYSPAVANGTLFSEGNGSDASPRYVPLCNNSTTGTGIRAYLRTNTVAFLYDVAGAASPFGASQTLRTHSFVDTGTLINTYVDGAVDINQSYSRSSAVTVNNFAIGASVRPTTAAFFIGGVSEFIAYASALSGTNRGILEANAKQYFGTP